MTLRRGFEVTPGETAVVIEDVITTGGSTREVIESLRQRGVRVLAAGSIIDRSGGKVDLGVPRAAWTLSCGFLSARNLSAVRAGHSSVKPGSRPADPAGTPHAAHQAHHCLRRHRFSWLASATGARHNPGRLEQVFSEIEGNAVT